MKPICHPIKFSLLKCINHCFQSVPKVLKALVFPSPIETQYPLIASLHPSLHHPLVNTKIPSICMDLEIHDIP